MSILCAVTSLFQLVIFITLTGVLASIAAVSRLMEVSIALIHPLAIFMLRQSGKLVILLVIQSARLTLHALNKMCTLSRVEVQGELATIDVPTTEVTQAEGTTSDSMEGTQELKSETEIEKPEDLKEPIESEEQEVTTVAETLEENGDEEAEDAGEVAAD